MSECWLYKQSTDGLPVDSSQSAPDEQENDTFSFWEPLDSGFLTAMIGYARDHGFAVVSPVSTDEFFADQAWPPALQAGTSLQVCQSFSTLVSVALHDGRPSPLGTAFSSLAGS